MDRVITKKQCNLYHFLSVQTGSVALLWLTPAGFSIETFKGDLGTHSFPHKESQRQQEGPTELRWRPNHN